MEPFPRKETRTRRIPCFNNSQKSQSKTQESSTDMAANHIGVDSFSLLTMKTPQIEQMLVKHEDTNDLYKPLLSTIVLRQNKTLGFENGLTIDPLVDS